MKLQAKLSGIRLITLTLCCLTLTACMTANEHHKDLADTSDRAMTLGMVQKNITAGTQQSQVATVLGSPNIVTRDYNNQETWIYDKIASEASFSQDSGGANGSINGQGGLGSNSFGGGISSFPGFISGNLGGNYNKQSGAASITQRTLTVVIKFDARNQVESLNYHSSKF